MTPLTMAQTAAILGCTRQTVHSLINSDILHPRHVKAAHGGRLALSFDPGEVAALIDSGAFPRKRGRRPGPSKTRS